MGEFEHLAQLFSVLSDKTRVRIIVTLGENSGYSASDLASSLGIAPSALSNHLRLLRLGKLISVERRGKNLLYSLSDDRIYSLIRHASQLFG